MAHQGEHGISWTNETWNCLRGCSRVSSGCINCYAERQALRFSGKDGSYEGLVRIANGHPQWTGTVEFIEKHLTDPLHWKKPRMIFVNSMSDLFHENIPDEWIDRVFAVMALSPQHVFQCLTKRPERMLRYCSDQQTPFRVARQMDAVAVSLDAAKTKPEIKWPLANCWAGVSCEDQKTADERIPLLLKTPAAVRWISAEPLLGPVDLKRLDYRKHLRNGLADFIGYSEGLNPEEANKRALADVPEGNLNEQTPARDALSGEWFDGWDSGDGESKLDWVVCGGESGPGARPFNIQWARDVRDQCRAANVPVFIKQLGAHVIQDGDRRIKKDRKGGDWHEWPHDLRVREFPKVSV